MEKKEIVEKVTGLKYKDETTKLFRVYPSLLESLFDFNGSGISPIGGRDLDYEGETADYYFSGSAYYGTCEVTKKHGKKKPKEVPIDVYTRTSFEFNGRIIKDIPPAIRIQDVDEEMRQSVLNKDGDYRLWYISFVSYGIATLHPFYAKSEIDVVNRALSIWNKYDEIKTSALVEEAKERWGKDFSRLYKVQPDVYVLAYEEK